MAANPCRTKKTDLDLGLIRTHWDDMLLKGVAVTRLLSKLRSSLDTNASKQVAQAGERLEMAGQILDAATRPSIGGVLAAIGKVLSIAFGTISDLDEAAAKRSETVAELSMAAKALDIARRQFEDSRERYRESFERFWECTEKHRPRQVALDVTLEGTMQGPLAAATFARRWAVTAKVVPDTPPDAPYDDRLLRWLADPALKELLRGKAEVYPTMPAYDWVATRPDVVVDAELPVFTGKPLLASVAVTWSRSAPTGVKLRVGVEGEQLVLLSVTFTTQGRTSALHGEQEVGQILKTQLLRHRIGGRFVPAVWDAGTTSWRYENAITRASGPGEARCVAVITAEGR